MLDLGAPIVPGRSAAGFRLGQTLESVLAGTLRVVDWAPGESLEGLFRGLPSHVWVRAVHQPAVVESAPSTSLYLGGGAVILLFNSASCLESIRVADGYRGSVWNHIVVGSMISDAKAHLELDYDPGEEQFYPADESQANVEFFTNDYGDPSVPISTISINSYARK